MNLATYSGILDRIRYELRFRTRGIGSNPNITAFGSENVDAIQRIYVINLDRDPGRWHQVSRELKRFHVSTTVSLSSLTRRFPAVDARYLAGPPRNQDLVPTYSLADQWFVEGTPQLGADVGAPDRPIQMTAQEVAVALSHIGVWRLIAASRLPFALVLEDDIYFRRGFGQAMNKVWAAYLSKCVQVGPIDMLYLSYKEAGVAHEKRASPGLLREPDRGLWQLSGYVLSRSGAQKLLDLLPTRGPIDLWLNFQFGKLDVVVAQRPIIDQRMGIPSTNSYSVLPVLSQVGFLTREERLIPKKNSLPGPIFAFGEAGSGLTALATALSMLGYRCCNDLMDLPTGERADLLKNGRGRVFDAYVNIGSLGAAEIGTLARLYPLARFIITTRVATRPHSQAACKRAVTGGQSVHGAAEGSLDIVASAARNAPGRVVLLPAEHEDKWQLLAELLGCDYPALPYPNREELDQRRLGVPISLVGVSARGRKRMRFDKSPWIVPAADWTGIRIAETDDSDASTPPPTAIWDGRSTVDDELWSLRDDTFPSNLALFRRDNVSISNAGATLTLRHERTSVREFTSGAVASKTYFLYGIFEAEIRPSDVPGLVTGIFLHRNGPRQEIDIEFVGKGTSRMMVNVYFNPGIKGTRLEFGYRGTPVLIDLGFDASKAFHRYTIAWNSNFIDWYVDGRPVCRRVNWDPTPIPDLPLQFNVNLWHSRSKELAGGLDVGRLPAHTDIRMMRVSANPDPDDG